MYIKVKNLAFINKLVCNPCIRTGRLIFYSISIGIFYCMIGIKGTLYPRKRELNVYNNIVLKPRQLCILTDFFYLATLECFY